MNIDYIGNAEEAEEALAILNVVESHMEIKSEIFDGFDLSIIRRLINRVEDAMQDSVHYDEYIDKIADSY